MTSFRLLLAMILIAGALPADAQAPPLTRADLLAEVPALISFQVIPLQEDTLIALSVRSQPPPKLHLSVLQRELRYALTWLLEGAPSYDRAEAVRRFGADSAAMRVWLIDGVSSDERFTAPMLRMAVPLLDAQGVRVAGAVPPQASLTEDEVVALAARFFQISGGTQGHQVLVCAKPDRLRDRPIPRDDAVEAWLYSAMRIGAEDGSLMPIVMGVLGTIDKPATPQAAEDQLWAGLEASMDFRQAVRAHAERTHSWAPARIGL